MKLFVFFGCLLFSAQSFSQDAARGGELFKKCIACHGDKGQGMEKQKAPHIAGQYDWYIESSIKAFQKGERKNPVMLPFIKNLSETDIKDLASFISRIK